MFLAHALHSRTNMGGIGGLPGGENRNAASSCRK